jgi:hypothetical protein
MCMCVCGFKRYFSYRRGGFNRLIGVCSRDRVGLIHGGEGFEHLYVCMCVCGFKR